MKEEYGTSPGHFVKIHLSSPRQTDKLSHNLGGKSDKNKKTSKQAELLFLHRIELWGGSSVCKGLS